MRKNNSFLFLLWAICLPIRLIALSLYANARLLAGMEAHSIDPEAFSIENSQEWVLAAAENSALSCWNQEVYEGRANQLHHEMDKRKEAAAFFAEHLSEAYENTKNVLYFFGGPDFCYPDLFFPEMEHLILVGQEPSGSILDVEDLLSQKNLQAAMGKIRESLFQLPFRSYFVTETLHKELSSGKYGMSTLLAVSIVLSGYELFSYREIFLDNGGMVTAGGSSSYPSGIELTYKKNGSDRERRVYYFSLNLLKALPPSFLQFIHEQPIDTAFYKASSFITQDARAAQSHQVVLQEAKYVVQGESGIPLAYFNHGEWQMHLFGIYVRPYYSDQSVPSDWGMQKDLAALYVAKIDQQASEEVKKMTKSIWGERRYEEWRKKTPFFSDSDWGGIFPIHFDYGGQLTDKPYRPYTTAVQYAIKKKF